MDSVILSRPPNGPNAKLDVTAPGLPASAPDTETPARPTRRRFTDAYKLSIIAQVDACTDLGQVGALLRREGLYYSTLSNFRKLKAQGLLDGPCGRTVISRVSTENSAVPAAVAK